MTKKLLTLTEVGMIGYWVFAALVVIGVLNVPPEYMYSDHQNPIIISWNWSFFPLDILFAVLGLISRFGKLTKHHQQILSTMSLSLMFCAGLMAITFWIIQYEFSLFWWVINVWLIGLSTVSLFNKYRD